MAFQWATMYIKCPQIQEEEEETALDTKDSKYQ